MGRWSSEDLPLTNRPVSLLLILCSMKIGQEGDPKPSFSLTRNPAVTDEQSEFGDSETLEIARQLRNDSEIREGR